MTIGLLYNVEPGKKCWCADENGYYNCIITTGSDIVYFSTDPNYKANSVLIGVDYIEQRLHFGIFDTEEEAGMACYDYFDRCYGEGQDN